MRYLVLSHTVPGSNILNLVIYRTSDSKTQVRRAILLALPTARPLLTHLPVLMVSRPVATVRVHTLTCPRSAVIGEAVTWIMSQKLLIHLRDAAAAAAHRSSLLAVSPRAPSAAGSQTRRASASASVASRSPFSDSPVSIESKTRSTIGVDGDVLAWSGTSLTDLVGNLSDVELDVQVEVRRTEECVAAAAASAEVPRVVWVGSAGTNEKEGSLR